MSNATLALPLGVILLLQCGSLCAEWTPQQLLQFTRNSCLGWQASGATVESGTPIESSPIHFRERQIGTQFRLSIGDQSRVDLDVIHRDARPTRFVAKLYNRGGDPSLLLSITEDCNLQVARRINYSALGQALDIVTLDSELMPAGQPEWLNPRLEFITRKPQSIKHPGDGTPLRVAMVDSGVNYLLPEINRRLARDPDNQLVGYDFWDLDRLPYDAHPVNSGFFLQRHGTRSASLLLREAPQVELVPYRYPRPDMTRMRALVTHAANHQVSIVGLPLGSNRVEEWRDFAEAARAHPDILFIASAGNDGRDIDQRPVYPAALELENLLVVTSADDFVRPAERTNWGRKSVDYMVPAERVEALDYSGRDVPVSGSSYAVARVTALAARLKQTHRQWRASDIIAELSRRYRQADSPAARWVSSGYIADPLAGAPIKRRLMSSLDLQLPEISSRFRLPLDILVLDPNWNRSVIRQSLEQAYKILQQCDIGAGAISVSHIEGADYLRDLSTGSARTLLESVELSAATVVLARDTRMREAYLGEAFGIGNTRMRPWLTNSVWLMHEVEDPGIALAHELYHVLANDGAHVDWGANLMQGRTRPDGVKLTPQQCQQAQVVGVANRLLLN